MLYNNIFLSPRLSLIYNSFLIHQPVWDICCDHGQIGLSAYQSKNFKEVYFVDQVDKIIENLKKQFYKECFSSDNSTSVKFLATSAQRLEFEIFGNLAIAGVGAKAILSILRELKEGDRIYAQRIILAPQNHPDMLIVQMRDLLSGQYQLTEQKCVVEKARHRSVFIYDRIINPEEI